MLYAGMSRYATASTVVLGSGPFGLLLSRLAAESPARAVEDRLFLFYTDSREAERLRSERRSTIRDQDFRLADSVEIVADYTHFESGAWVVYLAVSSRQVEDTVARLLRHLDPTQSHLIVVFTKGLLERSTRRRTGLYTFSQYIEHLAREAGFADLQVAAANGPSLLAEIQSGRYAYFNLGATDAGVRDYLYETLRGPSIVLSDTRDRMGVELAGALKNPIAIACGMAEILPGAGSNAQGVLLSRGYFELFQVATGLGAEAATLFGVSGLADVVTTSTSAASRNRSYGMQFMRRSLTQANQPGFFERIELFLHPRRFIEQEVLENQELAEGALALTPILEIGAELGLKLPVYETLYEILSRRKPTGALLELITRDARGGTEAQAQASQAEARKAGASQSGKRPVDPGNVAGHKFKQIIERRTAHSVLSARGMQDRIHRQSQTIVSRLHDRLVQAKDQGDLRQQETLPRELSVWKDIVARGADEIREHIEELIEFYVEEISDRFRPGVRGALIHTIGPLRTVLGGLRPGSGIPHLGGEIETVRDLAGRYNILYAPTHRSHLDSVEVAFGLYGAGLPVPRYAAGSNLMTGPFWQWILKSLGAYAVDRQRTRNILYLECLTRYATMMLEIGIPSLVYPEGTRSRSGGIAPLKTGLLSTAIDAYRNSGSEILVVPVAVAYENVPEDREFAGVVEQTKWPSFLRGRTRVHVDLCAPIRVSTHIRAEDPALAIGGEITSAWERQLRVMPNHMVAYALTNDDQPALSTISMQDLAQRVAAFVDLHRRKNLATHNVDRILKEGLKVLKKRGFVQEKQNRVTVLEAPTLRYYSGMAGMG
ncbi:MAG: 1-acyl-sn-glycerol-3-phosphate acyltransferase [bacterium]|nr:1-acyl-sn-glycerol-3-phosphate acyltransferase [bacterium]